MASIDTLKEQEGFADSEIQPGVRLIILALTAKPTAETCVNHSQPANTLPAIADQRDTTGAKCLVEFIRATLAPERGQPLSSAFARATTSALQALGAIQATSSPSTTSPVGNISGHSMAGFLACGALRCTELNQQVFPHWLVINIKRYMVEMGKSGRGN